MVDAGGPSFPGMMLVRGNSLLSSERQDDPVTFDGEEWTLSNLLGSGTSSSVFAAQTHTQSKPTRAVKVIMVELMGSNERAELRLEYELWSQLRHPHVIQMFASSVGDARFCLLLELAGEELFAAITRMEELRERDTARWITQLLSALDHMHGLGIAHCDVKPENVLLVASEGGRLATKLSDFGCARRFSVSVADAAAADPAVAATAPRGSRGYAAPEQRLGCAASPAVDLWGLGVLSVHACRGSNPPWASGSALGPS